MREGGGGVMHMWKERRIKVQNVMVQVSQDKKKKAFS